MFQSILLYAHIYKESVSIDEHDLLGGQGTKATKGNSVLHFLQVKQHKTHTYDPMVDTCTKQLKIMSHTHWRRASVFT